MKQLVTRKHWALVYDNEKLLAEYYYEGNLCITSPIKLATDAVEQLDLYEGTAETELRTPAYSINDIQEVKEREQRVRILEVRINNLSDRLTETLELVKGQELEIEAIHRTISLLFENICELKRRQDTK